MKKHTRTAALALALVAAGLLAACQPYPTGSTVKPPASATHAHGIKDSTILVRWGFSATYCEYRLTVTDPANRVVFTSGGGPAVGTTFVVPLQTGTYSAWIEGSSPDGRPCGSTLEAISSL